MNGFHVLTITHRTASLEEVGQFVLGEGDALRASLEALKTHFGWSELLYASTCNRALFFFYSKTAEKEGLPSETIKFLKPKLSAKKTAELAAKWQFFKGQAALSHLFEVAASIDSLVLGEREIFRQLREAHDRAKAWKMSGDNIRLVFRKLVEAAKDVFTSTGLGSRSVSVAALAHQKMIAAGLGPDSRVLIIGAGQTNELLSKFLKKTGCREVFVFNRSLEKAGILASQALPTWRWLMWHQLQSWQRGFDFLIVCTASPNAIVTASLFDNLLKNDPRKGPKTVVDLSVPANVCSSIGEKDGVRLIEIESLKTIAEANRADREREAERAKLILGRHLQELVAMHRERKIHRALGCVPAEIALAKDRARHVFKKDIERLSPEARAVLEKALGYLEKKAVAAPMKAARRIALETSP